MRPSPQPGQIRPKVTTMPRPKTEASAYLDIYKLVNEKKRLRQELEKLEQRRDRIQKRLDLIENQVTELEQNAHQLRDVLPPEEKPVAPKQIAEINSFNTLFLEY